MLLYLLSIAYAEPNPAIPDDSLIDSENVQMQKEFPPSTSLQMLMTGSLGGVGAEQYYFPQLRQWKDLLSDQSITSHADHSTMVQGDWIVVGKESFAALHQAFRTKQAITCKEADAWVGLVTNQNHVLSATWSKPLLEKIDNTKNIPHWSCHSTQGGFDLLYVGGETQPSFPVWQPEHFEFRPTIHLDTEQQSPIHLVGTPMQELSRLVQYIEESEGIYIDAGGFVDGFSSVLDGQLSKHRAFEYQWLASLEPFALGIGRSELVVGIDSFIAEASKHQLPYLATNLEVTDPENNTKSIPFPKYSILNLPDGDEVVQVLFLSILDPDWQSEIPSIHQEGYTITNPNQAIEDVLTMLRKDARAVDAVVVLTTASSSVLEEIRTKGPNVDVLFGDKTLATHRIKQQTVELHSIESEQKAAPLTLPMDGVQTVQLHFADSILSNLQHNSIDVLDTFTPNESVQQQIMRNRFDDYADQNQVMLRFEGLYWNQYLDQKEWEKMLCGLLLEQTGADTVLLDAIPLPKGVGQLTKKHISDALAIDDIVELHRIPGKNYGRFLDQAIQATSTSCGVTPGTKSPKPRGSSIDNSLVYTVVTTDQMRLRRDLGLLFQAHQTRKWLDAPSQEVVLNKQSEPYGFRQLVLDGLTQRIVSENDLPTETQLLRAADTISVKRLWFTLNDVGMTVDSFESPQNEALSSVPESMLNNPSSAAVGANLDTTLEYRADRYKSTFRIQSQYASLYATVDDQEELQKQETGDDVRLSSTVSYSKSTWDVGPLGWMPFGELLWDSEWTPIELEDGTLSTRQSDFSLTGGLSLKPMKSLKTLKFGAMVNRDLAQFDTKPNEYAGSLQLMTSTSFAQALLWSNEGSMMLYGNTPSDDDSDLRLRAFGKSKFTMPVSSNFGLSLYATGLLVKGRSDDNNVWGHGWNVGFSMDVLGTFNL